MPVWHELTREWREQGRLQLVGITQEQHPDRCRLLGQWKGFDWPILWDPFNLTESKVVPNVVAVDEFGIVRSVNPSPETFEVEFLDAEFPLPEEDVEALEAGWGVAELQRFSAEGSFEHGHYLALSHLLWPKDGESIDPWVVRLERQAHERPEDPLLAFRAGVALRMRYDGAAALADDFQAAIDHWTRALALDPNQYIWRRRIQQYGPRMDKPYNFYFWVDAAQNAIRRRGEQPIELVAELTPAELAQPRRSFAQPRGVEPDPEGRIERDETGLVQVESAVAFATDEKRTSASVHIALRPNAELEAHWNNESEPERIWLGTDMPGTWTLSERLIEGEPVKHPVSDEVRRHNFELRLPEGSEGGSLKGYLLFYVCEGAEGTCRYLRRDFEIPIEPPGR